MESVTIIPHDADALAKQYLMAMLPCHYDLCLAQAKREIAKAPQPQIPALLMAKAA